MLKNVLIINYNTPYMTECLVRSINLFMDGAAIYVFDNSDKYPFSSTTENVTVFDNTKGQIIDFDKWLENYPDRGKSHGRVNAWGSAKHCYSIEKCMDLIEGDFIVLDSDVLLKKDISDLYDRSVIYCGEAIFQPDSKIQRVLPFICYINTEMCKKNGVHYFDDNYMHGLRKTTRSDMYDTGAGFMINAGNFPHRDIKCEDYVIHYGHGSWKKAGVSPKYNMDEWLEINRRYWDSEPNRKVVYTSIVGGYDALIDPDVISDGFDYICFTDSADLTSDVWQIRPMPEETDSLPLVKKQRYVKVNPHIVLPEYDVSIWVDGNIQIKGDMNKFIDESVEDGCSIYVPKHPSRNCTYSEARAVLSMRKDVSEIVNPQMDKFRKEGFPSNYGMLQSNILLRFHNTDECKSLMETWFEEIRNGSHRDQLSFNYALWKNGKTRIKYLDKKICKSSYFFWCGTHKKTTHPKMLREPFRIRTL